MPLLELPLIAQWGITANQRRTDCGAACVAMLLEFYGKRGNLTVDQLALETSLATNDHGLMPQQLVDLARSHGLETYVNSWTALDDIRYEIDHGRPVVALVAYRFITTRLDQGDRVPGLDGHFITLVGYDDTHFVADDPDYWAPYTERGHDSLLHITDLDAALDGTEYYRRCIFVKDTHMATQADINNVKTTLNTALLALNTAISAVNALTPDATVPVAPTSKVMWTTDGVNVRSTAEAKSDNSNKIGAIVKGQQLTVKYPSVNGWYTILAGADLKLIGGFVSAQFLSDGG